MESKQSRDARLKFVERQCTSFTQKDPFNDHILSGYQCRKEGNMLGTLLISSINGEVLDEPQIIYGVPNFSSPYSDFTSDSFQEFEKEREGVKSFYITSRRTGIHVTVFKYKYRGEVCVSVKGRGVIFIQDNDKTRFQLLTLTKKKLGLRKNERMPRDALKRLPMSLAQLALLIDDNVQSVSCELCGKDLRSLTSSQEEVTMLPVYMTLRNGDVKPVIAGTPGDVGPSEFDQREVESVCVNMQEEDTKKNEEMREKKNMKLRLEYSHFATEGRLLFLLNQDGLCCGRMIYEVRPHDLRGVLDSYFDTDMEERVREIYHSLEKQNRASVDNVRSSLGMRSKEWMRYGKGITQFVKLLSRPLSPVSNGPSGPFMIITVGLPGSGKSYFAENLIAQSGHRWARINQDLLKTRKACEAAAKKHLSKGHHVLIDRTNIDIWQRAVWLNLAQQCGVSRVFCLYIGTPSGVCKNRIMSRVDHPTLPPTRESTCVVDMFLESFIPPVKEEGFTEMKTVSSDQEVDDVIQEFAKMVLVDAQ